MHDHSQLAGDRNLGLLQPAAFGKPKSPGFQRRPFFDARQQRAGRFRVVHPGGPRLRRGRLQEGVLVLRFLERGRVLRREIRVGLGHVVLRRIRGRCCHLRRNSL